MDHKSWRKGFLSTKKKTTKVGHDFVSVVSQINSLFLRHGDRSIEPHEKAWERPNADDTKELKDVQ